MVYLEYELVTKQVVQIHDAMPTVSDGYDYAISQDKTLVDNNGNEIVSNDFKSGDEFEQTIWINLVDENKNLLSYSAIRNNPQAKRLLQENAELKANQAILEQAILELTTLIAGGSN